MENRANTIIRLFELIAVFGGFLWNYLFRCRGINRTPQRAVLLRKSIEKLGSVFNCRRRSDSFDQPFDQEGVTPGLPTSQGVLPDGREERFVTPALVTRTQTASDEY